MSRVYIDAYEGPPIPFGILSVADVTNQNDGHFGFGAEYEPLMCADVEIAPELCDPPTGTNEVQSATITGSPTGGSYRLTVFGQTTVPIAYNASNATVQAALEGLDAIEPGDIAVTGTATARVFTWGGRYAAENVAQITAADVVLTGGTAPAITTATTTPGAQTGKTAATNLPIASTDPFTLYMMPRCAGINEWKRMEGRAGTMFAGAEQRGIETALWIQFTAAAAAVTVDGTAQTVVKALGELEQWAGENYNTLAVLHAPRDVVTLAISEGLVKPHGNVLKTELGTPVVAGAGYGKTGPNGTAAVAGTGWMFATGHVRGQRGNMAINGPYMEAANDNTYRALVERSYLFERDCLLGGIAVTL